jgi:hypothetical protein
MDLCAWLESAEARWRKAFGLLNPPAGALRDLQFYAYHAGHSAAGTPVVCLGSNYSQDPGKTEPGCRANLAQWVRGYLHLRRVFESGPWKDQWVERGWSSPQFPMLPREDEIFFVMANLCPWITEENWAKLDPATARGLFRASQSGDQYRHLEQLLLWLRKEKREFVLVGHGINPNVLPDLLEFFDGRAQWLQYANLTYAHTPTRWDSKKGRFYF